MRNNMIRIAIAVGKNYIYFIYDPYKIIENNKIEEGTLLNSTNDSVDPYDYHPLKRVEIAFEEVNFERIHTYYPNDDDDEEEEIWTAQREIDA